jgi:hypothetical protein
MDNDQCEEWFHSQGKNIKLQPEHLCAGHEVGLEDGCQVGSIEESIGLLKILKV